MVLGTIFLGEIKYENRYWKTYSFYFKVPSSNNNNKKKN